MSDLTIFFEQFPPDSTAVSVRANYFISSLDLEFQKYGYKGTLYTTSIYNGSDFSKIKVENIAKKTWGRSSSLKSRAFSELLVGLKLSYKIMTNKKCHNILISSPSYITMLVAATTSIFFKKKLLLDIRDAYPETFLDAKLLSRKSFLYKALSMWTRWIYGRAALISWATSGLMPKCSDINQKSIIAYNGFPASLLKHSSQKYENFTLCFHGLMGVNQDIDLIVKIIDGLSNDINFVIIGYGPKKHIFEERQWPNVKFKGHLTHENTLEEIAKCHVGLSFRKDGFVTKNSFPVKLWEYIGLGMPVVSTPASEAGQFIQEHSLGFVFDGLDTDEIINTIRQLKINTTLKKSFKNNRSEVRDKYTREQLSKKWAKIIIQYIEKVKNEK